MTAAADNAILDARGYACPRPKYMIMDVLIHQRPARLIAWVDDLAPRYGYCATVTRQVTHDEITFTRGAAEG